MVKAIRIKDFPDYYITDTGDVYSRKIKYNPTGRIRKLKPWVNKFGYKMVDLVKYGQKIHKPVHRLVSEACRQTGVDFRCISSCCLGHRKAAGGYQWRYKK